MANKKEKKYDIARTPIIAVMGHVNHGKTSLLDVIRDTSVQETEAGGITQNIRAHQIDYSGYRLSFIDTPGHEAFTEMRSRGSQVTDIVMLVVAVDDGVQPQTKESIKYAKVAKVPVVVAINKTDLPGKKLDKLKQELSSAGLQLEEYGGDTIVVEVSAKTKSNIDKLLDSLLLVAELSNLKPAPKSKTGEATGFVLESLVDKNLGPVALVLVQSGKVESRNYLVHGKEYERVRTMLDENQNPLKEGIQGDPIWVSGIDKVLQTGELVKFMESEKLAKAILSEQSQAVEEVEAPPKTDKVENDLPKTQEEALEAELDLDLLAELIDSAKTEEEIRYLNVVLRASTVGTLEVASQELEELNSDTVKVKIISSEVGKITERDIQSAKNAYGIVIGFQVEPTKNIREIAEKEHVLVKNFEIIYELLEELGEVLDSMEDPVEEEVEVARAVVKQAFKLSNGNYVAGCSVEKGTVVKGYKVFVEREGERIEPNAKITSLKKQKNEVKEVKKGEECGIMLEPNFEIKDNDVVVCYKVERG